MDSRDSVAASVAAVARTAPWRRAPRRPNGRTTVSRSLLTATLGLSAACGEPTAPVLPVVAIELTSAMATLSPGDTLQLWARLLDANGDQVAGAQVSWSSSDQDVVGVSTSGLVTGVAVGQASVAAQHEGVTATLPVSVLEIRFASLAAGGNTCGVAKDGTGYCWGANDFGQLGEGTQSEGRSVPGPITGGLSFLSLTTVRDRACGLTTSGAVYCWGATRVSTLLGTVLAGIAPSPVRVETSLVFSSISGTTRVCGVTDGGDAYCWGGENTAGQVGDGTQTRRDTPARVVGSSTFRSVAVGGSHTCGLTAEGTALCWGSNEEGSLGTGNTSANCMGFVSAFPCSLVPVAVAGDLVFTEIVAAGAHACGLTDAGAAYCWGSNRWGAVGNGSTVNALTPDAVTGGIVFTSLSAGSGQTCGVSEGGTIYCWGRANGLGVNGPVGTCEFGPCITEPLPVPGGPYDTVSIGGEHTCALRGEAAFCWGLNTDGQLGDGTTIDRTTPVHVRGSVMPGTM